MAVYAERPGLGGLRAINRPKNGLADENDPSFGRLNADKYNSIRLWRQLFFAPTRSSPSRASEKVAATSISFAARGVSDAV
jgi:hypothetical protein